MNEPVAREAYHRDQVALVGIALVVNDAVPFRYPTQGDVINGLQLEYTRPHKPEAALLAAELNSERLRKARSMFWRLTRPTFAEVLLPPSAKLYGENLELVIDNLRLVCYPLRMSSKSKQNALVSFSVVLALDASYDGIVDQSKAKLRTEPSPTSYGESYPLSLSGVRPYRVVARDLAKALLYAENAERLVTRETAQGLDESNLSALQQEFKHVYHGLVERGVAHFHLPGRRLCASFNLTDPRFKPTMPIRPYHSLIFDDDGDVMDPQSHGMKEEIQDMSPAQRLSSYFRQHGAIKSVSDASEHFGMTLEQTCRLADHLRQWEHAKVCHKLQSWSMFQVNPSVDLRREVNPLFQAFSVRFPNQDLSRILARVTEPRNGTRVPRRLRDFTEIFGESTTAIFSWLLRYDLIVEVFQFIYFVPSPPPRTVSRRSSFNFGTEPASPKVVGSASLASSVSHPALYHLERQGSQTGSSSSAAGQGSAKPQPTAKVLMEYLDGKNLTKGQVDYLKSVWDLNNPVFRVLLKVCPHFGASNHIQEILFRTGISLSALKIVAEQYSECLFIAIHEL